MRFVSNGLIVCFSHVSWIDHGEDEDGEFACIHMCSGDTIDLTHDEVDMFLREFDTWCDAE